MHEVQTHRLHLSGVEAPGTVDEALALLAEYGERARIVAGGTDVLLELTRGARPNVDTLIDITRIPGLDSVEFDGTRFRLGPNVTHNQVVRSRIPELALPLAQACWEIGSAQLRNRATIVGNVVTASPANDTISPLRALDATIELSSSTGVRVVPIDQFHTGVRRTVMRPDELVTAIEFRAMLASERGVYVKAGLRKAQAISVVHLTCIVDVVDERVRNAVLTLGSVAPTIVRSPGAEGVLVGSALDDDTIETAARVAAADVHPIDDIRSSATYRSAQVEVMTRRALHALRDGVERSAWPDRPVTLESGAPAAVEWESMSFGADAVITSSVNGRMMQAPADPSETLLDWLRDRVGLTGAKEGCAEGECGACTVHLDGRAVLACLTPASRAQQANVVTIEGLAGNGGLDPLQQAFVDDAAVQCGFCIPGFLMSGAKLLDEKPSPSLADIKVALAGNLCRCTGYYKIIDAFGTVAR
jgi:carbon-monoxide dehydrogenase medium subunit